MKRNSIVMQTQSYCQCFAKDQACSWFGKNRIKWVFSKLPAGALLILGLLSFFVSSGCIASFETSSYNVQSKSKKETRQTNFRVESVSAEFADEQELKEVLWRREREQNEALVPVPYRVNIGKNCHYVGHDYDNFLWFFTLGVWPNYDIWRYVYDIQTDIPGSLVAIKGTESETEVIGWVVLPVVLPYFLLQGDLPSIDFRSGSLEERLGNAAFDSLTKVRYDLAIAEMTTQAITRLQAGSFLSETDKRLLATVPQKELLVSWAKHPDDVNRGKQALQEIVDVEDLLDIAFHAAQLPIREEAANRVSGLSESRFADLVRKAKDESVLAIFLRHVSDETLLCEIMKDATVPTSNRMLVLARIKSEDILADIAKNAPDASIRSAAIGKVENPKFLLPIVLDDPNAENRAKAFQKIHDSSIIGQIVRRSKDANIRLLAVLRIDDESTLVSVVENDPDESIRKQALAKIANPKELEKIAKENAHEEIRVAAVGRIQDEEVLCYVVEHDSSRIVKEAAISKIGDPAFFAKIATTAAESYLRLFSIGKVSDPSLLVQVAKTDSDPSVRLAALRRLDSTVHQDVFAEVALKETDSAIRRFVVEQVSDSSVLVQVAKTDSDPSVRLATLRRLDSTVHQDVFAEVALNDADSGIRGYIVEQVSDSSVLVQVAKTDSDSSVRLAALRSLDSTVHQDVFAEVALKETDSEVRRFAVEQVSDPSVLVQVAKTDSDPSIRLAALRRLDSKGHQDVFIEVVLNDAPAIRRFAIEHLTEDSKRVVVRKIQSKPVHYGDLFLSGLCLGMEEVDVKLMFDILMVPIPGRPFMIGRTEVTQSQWESVMGNNPSKNKGPDLPVENVSWNDCQEFIKKLNAKTGKKFRLPTEEEWEYACRAGGTGNWGKRANGEEGPLDAMGWYKDNSAGRTHPVGQKEPNAFGLYDMHGNVWEWTATAGGTGRVLRGGGYWCRAGNCTASYRGWDYPDALSGSIGFRLALSLD